MDAVNGLVFPFDSIVTPRLWGPSLDVLFVVSGTAQPLGAEVGAWRATSHYSRLSRPVDEKLRSMTCAIGRQAPLYGVPDEMLRAFFLAMGIYAFILGLECLVLDKAVLQPSREASASAMAQQVAPALREIAPAEWAPWSLLSAGAVVTLYSFTIPAKLRS